MRVGRVLAAMLALSAAGCIDTATMVPVNDQAKAIGSPVLHFARGMPGGLMKVTMPDGEDLPGTFSVDNVIAPGSDGNFHATARGPRTAMTCHGTMVAGHGSADCQDQNGALYRIPL